MVRCLVSGIAWGGIAFVLGGVVFGPLVLAGVAASPVIGLLVGALVFNLRRASALGRVIVAAVSLYGSATLFGSALGLASLLTRRPIQNSEVFFEPIMAVLWGLTFTGLVAVLWPISYATLEWVLAATADESRTA
jgi:hypothetical protein